MLPDGDQSLEHPNGAPVKRTVTSPAVRVRSRLNGAVGQALRKLFSIQIVFW
jgi:hypothetical protein